MYSCLHSFDSVARRLHYPRSLHAQDSPRSTLLPHSTQILQDTLVQSSEYVLCALSVARQSVQLKPTAHSSIVMQAVIHEVEAVQGLVESALMQLQMRPHLPTEPHTLH